MVIGCDGYLIYSKCFICSLLYGAPLCVNHLLQSALHTPHFEGNQSFPFVCVCVCLWVCVRWQLHRRLRPQLIFKAAWDHEVLSRSPLRINVTSLLAKRTRGLFFSKRDREDGESVCVFLPLSRFLQPGLAYLLIRLFLICDRLHYPPFDLQKLQSVFRPKPCG